MDKAAIDTTADVVRTIAARGAPDPLPPTVSAVGMVEVKADDETTVAVPTLCTEFHSFLTYHSEVSQSSISVALSVM